jgi:hypothetical protein
MASARELLEQADALMRRNRAGMIDTEIPELREVVSMVALAPPPATPPGPTVLDDVPELTEAVEEIEISSIVELPEDIDESSGWLHHDHGELRVVSTGPDSMIGRPPMGSESAVEPAPAIARSALALVGDLPARPSPIDAPPSAPVEASPSAPVEAPPSALVEAPIVPVVSVASVVTAAAAPDAAPDAAASHTAAAPVAPPAAAGPSAPDEWARWEVLADEIRMQVLQRIDLFTEARLKDELSAHLRPIVDRAGAEMVATINDRVGGLIRSYIAEAIEREIEKWRGAPR